MDDSLLKLTDISFPIAIIEHYKTRLGSIFEAHLHEHHLDLNLLSSYQIAPFQQKYLDPLNNNLVIFKNRINSKYISEILDNTIKEYKEKQNGYELKNLLFF